MLCLRKCCCCSLKDGVFTVTIIDFIIRICCATMLLFERAPQLFHTSNQSFVDTACGFGLGWYITTAAISYVALKGIVQKNYILLYPLIVTLTLELGSTIFIFLYLSMLISVIFLLYLIIALVVYGLYIIFLICLYRQIKQNEKNFYSNPLQDLPV